MLKHTSYLFSIIPVLTLERNLYEEVDYGSFDIDAIPHTDSDHAWSTHMRMIIKTKRDKGIILI